MTLVSLRRRSISTVLSLAVAASLVAVPTLRAQEAAPGEAGELKQVAVIALSGYSEIVNDINFMGSLADRPQLGQMLEGSIALFTQGKGLAGIDKSKPWGIILQTDGQAFLPVACIPVTDLSQLLGIAQGFQLQIADGAEGVKEVSLPNGQTLFVKENNGWAYLSQSSDAMAKVPADPQAAFATLTKEYDVGARISVQNVPPMYRQMAVGAMKSGMQQGLERKDDETDEEFAARKQMAEAQMAQVEQMINEVDDATFGISIDSKQQRAFIDVIYRFLPGSKMAKQISGYGQPHTNFAGFFQPDAAATMSFASKADPATIKENLDQLKTMIATMRKQAEKAIDEEKDIPDDATRDALKGALGDFLEAAQATIEAGQMDGGAALHLHPDSLTFVAGGLVKQPAKVEEGLKKIAAVAQKDPDFSGVQWNTANHAGVNFHTLSVPVPEDEEDAQKLLGEKVDVAIGIGPDSVYVAVGHDNLNAINQAIDASKAEPNKAVPPFEVSLSLGQIMAAAAANADEDDREIAQSVADMLQNDAQGRDHVRIAGKLIENGLRYRIEAEEGVLRAIGKAAIMTQQKAQQQQLAPQ